MNRKSIFAVSLLLLFAGMAFFAACDSGDYENSYKFKGTVELSVYPDSDTVSLSALAAEQFDSKLRFQAIVRNERGQEIANPRIYWGTKGIYEEFMTYPANNKMTVWVGDADYMPQDVISVQAGFSGVLSSSKTITFIN